MARAPSDPGASLGRYQLMFLLGQGGMGEVHLARLTGAAGFEKLCIVKTILPQMKADPQFVERFHHEARVLVQLNHSNIAQVYDMGEVDQTLYMAIEYVPGVDLSRVESRVRQQASAMPVPIALYLSQQIGEALGYAHRKTGPDGTPLGIVHRDISPQNVMVSYEGEVKVIDFGLAKSAARSQHTLPQTVMGKLGYMSPEQAMARTVDHRSDIFSAGIVAWEMFAGRQLYAGGTMGEMVAQMAFPTIPPLRSVRPEISPTLEQIVMRALQVDPAARYTRADEFSRSLNELAVREGLTVGAEEVGNYVRAICPEEFAAERQLQSKLSLLRRKVAMADTEPEVRPAIDGTLVRPSRPELATEEARLTAAQRALSVHAAAVGGVATQPGSRPGSAPGAQVGADAAAGSGRTVVRGSQPPVDVTATEPLVVPRSRAPLLVVALLALAGAGGLAAVLLAREPAPAPVVVASPDPRPAAPVDSGVATAVAPPAKAVPTLGEVEVTGPLSPVRLDGDEAIVLVPRGQRPPFELGDAVLLVGEVAPGKRKAPLYAHGAAVDVKATLVKILASDGQLDDAVKLFAVRDPSGRASAPVVRREPPPRPRPPELVRAEPAREAMRPEPFPTPTPNRAEPARDPAQVPARTPAVRQLLGGVGISIGVVRVANQGDFDYTDCKVRLVTNRTAFVGTIARGREIKVRMGEFLPDGRPADPRFAENWSAVYCAEGRGYFKTYFGR